MGAAAAAPLRVATYSAELTRKGPGLLVQAIVSGKDAQVAGTLAVIVAARPDVLVLTEFDWDYDGVALRVFQAALAEAGHPMAFGYSGQPNAGRSRGYDLDRDGRVDWPEDREGYGKFTGAGGMVLLSRYPMGEVRDHTRVLWRDMPGAVLPVDADGAPYWPEAVAAALPVTSGSLWDVAIETPGGRLHVLTIHASAPVFDGAEDQNGLRNAAELAFWPWVLAGGLGPAPERYVIAGILNQDPAHSEGDVAALAALLSDPRLQDPHPGSGGCGVEKDAPTADWDFGMRRVDYILPQRDLLVRDCGVLWSDPELDAAIAAAGPHRLVWVDLE